MSNWVKDKIGNVADSFAGGTPSRSRPDYFNGEIPWISSSEVNLPYIEDTKEKITELGLENSSAKWIPQNSVLVAMYGATAGVVSKLLINATSNQAVLALVPDKDKIDGGFLYYQVKQNKEGILFLAQGSGQPNLSKDLIDNYEIYFPVSVPEQRQIATILSTADAVIEKTQAAIAKYKAIKQGMLQDLFTRGIDTTTGKLRPSYQDAPELYKESKLGWIPKEWEEVTIENIAKVHGRVGWKGYTVSDLRETGPLALGATHIDKENKLDLSKPVHLSMEKFKESPEIMVYFGDILVVQRGTIGKIVIIDREIGDATINPSVVILNTIKINSFFLYFQLCSFIGQRQIELLTSQTGVPMISQKQINSIKIAIPKNDNETHSIAIRIQSIDKLIFNEEELLSKQKQIKAGLMNDLLSGRKKVKVREEVTG